MSVNSRLRQLERLVGKRIAPSTEPGPMGKRLLRVTPIWQLNLLVDALRGRHGEDGLRMHRLFAVLAGILEAQVEAGAVPRELSDPEMLRAAAADIRKVDVAVSVRVASKERFFDLSFLRSASRCSRAPAICVLRSKMSARTQLSASSPALEYASGSTRTGRRNLSVSATCSLEWFERMRSSPRKRRARIWLLTDMPRYEDALNVDVPENELKEPLTLAVLGRVLAKSPGEEHDGEEIRFSPGTVRGENRDVL